MKDVLWETFVAGTWHCCQPLPTVLSPELAKPGTQTPVLTKLTAWQRPEAGGRWNNLENARGSVMVSSLKKQKAGVVSKVASIEPKASWITRSRAPKSQPCQPLLVEAEFGGSTVGGYPQWGTLHQDTCVLLKQLLHWGAGSQSLIGTPYCTGPTPGREVRTLWRCTSWL